MGQIVKKICLFIVVVASLSWMVPQPTTTIYMIGDSTMANKDTALGNQERGWGQLMSEFFTSDVEISNHARNGRSSKSFISEGLWQKVYDSMREGDYLIIQFGHNDEKADTTRHTDPGSTFDANLRLFVEGARQKGATPILCNSIVRRNFAKVDDAVAQDDVAGQSKQEVREGDKLIDTHGDYLISPRRVADAEDVVFIDMNRLTHEMVESMGPIESRSYFVWAEPNTVAAYPKGKKDNTHLNIEGARAVAALAVSELQKKIPEIAEYIR